MHTIKKGSQRLARRFMLDHSFPKLVTSLKPYWTRPGHDGHNTLAKELEWEESMMSLLEVGRHSPAARIRGLARY